MEHSWMLDYDPANCAIGAALEILGERATFLVLREAFNGVRRFDDMQRRTAIPRQVLTSQGLDLYPVLVALMQWGDRYEAGPDGPPVLLRHRDCGEPVRLQLSCRAGHVLESARDVTPVPGPGARKIA